MNKLRYYFRHGSHLLLCLAATVSGTADSLAQDPAIRWDPGAVPLLFEDYEGLPLQTKKDEPLPLAPGGTTGWTHTPPPGWVIDNSQFQGTIINEANPDRDGDGYADLDGTTEWAGWSFASTNFWVATARQGREDFTMAKGNVAVADPDEWIDGYGGDSGPSPFGAFNSILSTPAIPLSGIAPGLALLRFVSSWNREVPGQSNNQTGIIWVSFDGGAPIQVLKWDCLESSATFKTSAVPGEVVVVPLGNPSGAREMVVSFQLKDALNDWWWAIDDVSVSGAKVVPFDMEVFEGAPVRMDALSPSLGSDLRIQWYKGTGTNRTVVRGATSHWLELPVADFDDAGQYSVDITSLAGASTVNVGRLGVSERDPTWERVLFVENFEGLVLGPNVEEGITTGIGGGKASVVTKSPPAGWIVENNSMRGLGNPDTDGVVEWAGWSFADREWWATAGGQGRSLFLKGNGTIAVADGDEWDDLPRADGAMNTFLVTPDIDVSGLVANSVVLRFDSSWRPESPQKALVRVSFDGGDSTELLRWTADQGPTYHADSQNETVVLAINNPASALRMKITFGYVDAGNNWWWAIDHIELKGQYASTPPTGPVLGSGEGLPGLIGGAFTDFQSDPQAKTLSARLPVGGEAGFVTITPAVRVRSTQIIGDRLVVVYE
jgi:hypothetical protein